MIRSTRLGAAATIAALGVSLATPALGSASAGTNPVSLPSSSALTAALDSLVSSPSPLPALTDSSAISAALSQLGSLPSLAPGAPSPLTSLTGVLDAIAATPGVSGTMAATTLDSLATTLSNPDGVPATALAPVISGLQTVSMSLPTPLSTVVSQLASALAGSGSVLGTIQGLSASDVSTTLAELTMLGGLTAGSQSESLPGLAAVITDLGAQAPLVGTPAQTLLDQTAATIETDPVTGSALGTLAALLDNVSSALPAPLSTTVTSLAGELSTDASTVSGTPGTGGSTMTSGTSGTRGTGGTSGSTPSTRPSGTNASTSSTGHPAVTNSSGPFVDSGLFRRDKRSRHAVTVTLYCHANPGRICTDSIKVSERGYTSHAREVHFRAGRTDHWTVTLTAVKAQPGVNRRVTRRRPAMRVVITSHNYKVTRTVK